MSIAVSLAKMGRTGFVDAYYRAKYVVNLAAQRGGWEWNISRVKIKVRIKITIRAIFNFPLRIMKFVI